MKTLCLLLLVTSCTSFKIFPVANRRLSVNWNVEPHDVEPTTTETTTPLQITDKFTNSPESLLIISEVTAPEEIDETETIKNEIEINATTELNLSTTESQDPTTSTTNASEIEVTETVKTKTPDEMSIASTSEAPDTTVTITSTKMSEATTSKDAPTAARIAVTTEKASTSINLVENSSSDIPLSVNLLPPKTEYRKYDFDPRYDDWNKVPQDFDAI